MKVAIFIFVVALVAAAQCVQFGDECTHTGVQAKDDAACGETTNNMLCGTGGKCDCADKYGLPGKFTKADDGKSCVSA